MKKYITIFLIFLMLLSAAACGIEAKGEESSSAVQNQETVVADSRSETGADQKTDHIEQGQLEEKDMDQIYIKVGKTL